MQTTQQLLPFLASALLLSAVASAHGQDVASRFEPGVVEADTGGPTTKLSYQLLKPAKVEAGKTYPLVLFLHGAGERGDNNVAQLKYFPTYMSDAKMREKYPCFLLAPQCPKSRRWGSLEGRKKVDSYTDKPVAEAQLLEKLMKEAMAKYPIDKSRVYLTGLSMGGYGSWELATRHPEWFAAVAPICGAGDPTKAKALVGVPLWAWHGDKDRGAGAEIA